MSTPLPDIALTRNDGSADSLDCEKDNHFITSRLREQDEENEANHSDHHRNEQGPIVGRHGLDLASGLYGALHCRALALLPEMGGVTDRVRHVLVVGHWTTIFVASITRTPDIRRLAWS